MNTKRNLIVLSLVVMMLITAVGYASFGDTLVIAGNVSTASFDVQITDASIVGVGSPNGVATRSIVKQGNDIADKLTITITDALPGEEYDFVVQVHNFGTSPAKIGIATYQFDSTIFELAAFHDPVDLPVGGSQTLAGKIKIKNIEASEGTAVLSGTASFTLSYNQ